MIQNLIFSLSILIGSLSLAANTPLFSKGAETFKIVNEKSQNPVFYLLKSSPTKQAIASAVNATYHLPSPANGPAVEVKLEKMTLTPSKKKNEIDVGLQISGKEFELDSTLNRSELESGKVIAIKLPSEPRDFEMLKLTPSGSFTMQFIKSQDLIQIQNAKFKLEIESPLGDEAPEQINFTAKALREKKK